MKRMMHGLCLLVALGAIASVISHLVAVNRSSNLLGLQDRLVNLRKQQIGDSSNRPNQVHVALYDATKLSSTKHTGMAVSWATAQATQDSSVRFGRNASDLGSVVKGAAPCEQYTFCSYKSPWFHHVVIQGELLEPDTTYFYQCGGTGGGWSELLSFTTPVAIGSQDAMTFAVIGDLGQTQYSEQTIRHIINQPEITAILHAGDLSYADSVQPRWDRWGELVEPLASTCPWMVAAGNHEEERPCKRGVDPFIAYQARFRMPYDSHDQLQKENLYFAYRVGMVHFITLTPYVGSDAASLQFQWLKQELGSVNRALTPWVVVLMHGPWYNSNTAHQGREPHVEMKLNMEALLFEFKVDLVFSGHVHAYERSKAVYKEVVRPDGIVYVVLGDGGNREGLAPTYIHPKPHWSAFRQANYGFGLFRVANRTHARIEMYEDQETGDARLQDGAWLTSTQFRVQEARTTDA